MCFRKKVLTRPEDVSAVFQATVTSVKDLDRKEFNRFKEALDLAWKSWDIMLRVRTRDEKETKEIDDATEALQTELEK